MEYLKQMGIQFILCGGCNHAKRVRNQKVTDPQNDSIVLAFFSLSKTTEKNKIATKPESQDQKKKQKRNGRL